MPTSTAYRSIDPTTGHIHQEFDTFDNATP
jgi:hypothetical protein